MALLLVGEVQLEAILVAVGRERARVEGGTEDELHRAVKLLRVGKRKLSVGVELALDNGVLVEGIRSNEGELGAVEALVKIDRELATDVEVRVDLVLVGTDKGGEEAVEAHNRGEVRASVAKREVDLLEVARSSVELNISTEDEAIEAEHSSSSERGVLVEHIEATVEGELRSLVLEGNLEALARAANLSVNNSLEVLEELVRKGNLTLELAGRLDGALERKSVRLVLCALLEDSVNRAVSVAGGRHGDLNTV